MEGGKENRREVGMKRKKVKVRKEVGKGERKERE